MRPKLAPQLPVNSKEACGFRVTVHVHGDGELGLRLRDPPDANWSRHGHVHNADIGAPARDASHPCRMGHIKDFVAHVGYCPSIPERHKNPVNSRAATLAMLGLRLTLSPCG